jgi:hypothetical protein
MKHDLGSIESTSCLIPTLSESARLRDQKRAHGPWLPADGLDWYCSELWRPPVSHPGRSDATYVVSDTLNYLRGNHSLKFGSELRSSTTTTPPKIPVRCIANMAAFLAGTTLNVTLGDVSTQLLRALSVFCQDNYKLRPNLTWAWISLGLLDVADGKIRSFVDMFRPIRLFE